MIRIDSQDSTPIYRQVVDQVKFMVMAGQYVPGDQLESVSVLSARLRVNPMTISKAYSLLVREGVAERRPGVGLFVAAVSSQKVDRDRRKLLVGALRDAAAVVVQLGVGTPEAMEIFREHIARFHQNQERDKS